MRFIFASILFLSIPAMAQTSPSATEDQSKLGLHHESEIGYIVVGGNAKSQSFSGKQDTWYQKERDLYRIKGHYLNTRARNQQNGIVEGTAENWSGALRWEHILYPELFSGFTEAGVRGNRFIGVDFGQSYDLGGKYFFVSTDTMKWFAELGYQYLKEDFKDDGLTTTPEFREAHFIRLFSKVEYTYSPTVKFGFWGEYLPDLKEELNYRVNFGPEVMVILTDRFSLKFAYEGYYRNLPVAPNTIRFDFRHVTALIAKF